MQIFRLRVNIILNVKLIWYDEKDSDIQEESWQKTGFVICSL